MPLTPSPENYVGRRHMAPDVVPTAATDVIAEDCYLEELCLTGISASSATVTVWDKQGTPRAVVSGLALAAGEVANFEFSGRWCPGGIRWQASAANAVVGYVRVR